MVLGLEKDLLPLESQLLLLKRIIKIKLETVAPFKEIAEYLNCSLGTVTNVGGNSWQHLNNQIDDFSDEVVEYFRDKYPIDSLNILVFDNRTLEPLGNMNLLMI